jgi:hypothetical protein
MKLICAWCKLVLSHGTVPATHGICVVCSLKFGASDRTLKVISTLPCCGLPSVRVDRLRFFSGRAHCQSGILKVQISSYR